MVVGIVIFSAVVTEIIIGVVATHYFLSAFQTYIRCLFLRFRKNLEHFIITVRKTLLKTSIFYRIGAGVL